MSGTMYTTGQIAKGQRVNEWRQIGDQWVNKYSIACTTMVVYDVWERFSSSNEGGHYTRSHSTITYRDDGVCLGEITTRDISAEMDALPAYSEERSRAVVAWYDANKALARALTLAAFPEDFKDF